MIHFGALPREYRYAAVNRPPGYGAAPKGAIRIEPQPPGNSLARHGIVVYDRPLTKEEYEGYELYPYKPLAEVTADALDRLSRYGAHYAAYVRKGNLSILGASLSGGRHRTMGGFYTDLEGEALRKHIAAALLEMYPDPSDDDDL